MALTFDKSTTAAPLDLVVALDGVGVAGLHPTVQLRDVASGDYMDFADGVFKSSGWTTKAESLLDLGTGFYQYVLNVSASSGIVFGQTLVSEYHVPDTGYEGDTLEVILVTGVETSTTLLRKQITNRLEEASGDPGTLVLYDDDGVTPLLSWKLLDETGSAVLPSTGTPAKRSSAL